MAEKTFSISQTQIITYAVMAILSVIAFRDQVFETQSSSKISISELNLQIENLKSSILRLEEIAERPQITLQELDLRLSPLRDNVTANSNELKNRSNFIDETRSVQSELRLVIQKLEVTLQLYDSRLEKLENRIFGKMEEKR